jgi:hypothetical protein
MFRFIPPTRVGVARRMSRAKSEARLERIEAAG